MWCDWGFKTSKLVLNGTEMFVCAAMTEEEKNLEKRDLALGLGLGLGIPLLIAFVCMCLCCTGREKPPKAVVVGFPRDSHV